MKPLNTWFNLNIGCIWMWEVQDLKKAGLSLTLTLVVFEFFRNSLGRPKKWSLTLTLVVFEWHNTNFSYGYTTVFNLNIGCIWIVSCKSEKYLFERLTLTLVVFESPPPAATNTTASGLTLTLVVFEYHF